MCTRLTCLVAIVLIALTGVGDEPPRPPRVVKTIRSPGNRRAHLRIGSRQTAAATIERLESLHRPLGDPQPGDWLAEHEEAGQTFDEYVDVRPVTPTGRRSVIYVQPLGEFTPEQRRIIDLSAEYLGLYMTRTVKVTEDLSLSIIPDSARRTHPEWGMEQVLTTYVLQDVLKPRLPQDAATYIAFTASDLWPGEGWNFLYGQAMFRERVGVWSIYRNGDPAESEEAFRLCLLRTLKTASHEVGHTFSMQHCTAWQCNMNGRNHLEESDRSPLWLFTECHAKLSWATNTPPIGRFGRLAEFCDRHGLDEQRDYYEAAAAVLTGRLRAER